VLEEICTLTIGLLASGDNVHTIGITEDPSVRSLPEGTIEVQDWKIPRTFI